MYIFSVTAISSVNIPIVFLFFLRHERRQAGNCAQIHAEYKKLHKRKMVTFHAHAVKERAAITASSVLR